MGFSVFLFNDSSFVPPYPPGYHIFTHDGSTCLQQGMNITVNKVTRGIALYNSRNNLLQASCAGYDPLITTIEICEVMVMGKI